MPHRHSLAIAIPLMLFLTVTLMESVARGQTSDSPADSLDIETELEVIAELRGANEPDAAFERAHQLRSLVADDPEAEFWKVLVEQELAALDIIVQLDQRDRERMALATVLEDSVGYYYSEGKIAEAVRAAREMVSIRGELLGEDHIETADGRIFLSVVLEEAGLYWESREEAARALRLTRTSPLGTPLGVEAALNSLAISMERTGDLVGAEPLWREAVSLALVLYGEGTEDLATSLNNLGDNLYQQGRHGEAIDYLERSLAIRESLLKKTTAADERHVESYVQSLINLGTLFLDADEFESAAVFLERSRTLIEEYQIEDPSIITPLHRSLGVLAHFQGQYDKAIDHYERERIELLRIYDDFHPHVILQGEQLANSLARAGRMKEAVRLSESTIAQLERGATVENDPRLVSALVARADIDWVAGRYAEALSRYEEVVQRYEDARALQGDLSFLSQSLDPYEHVAACRLLTGADADAWPAFERARGRISEGMMAQARNDGLGPKASRERQTLLHDLREAEGLYAATARAFESQLGTQAELDDALARFEAARSAWQRHQLESGVAAYSRESATDLPRLQSMLDADQALVGWLDVDRFLPSAANWGLVVRNEGPVHWVRLEAERERSERAAEITFVEALRVAGDYGTASDRIWKNRVEPLMPHLDGVDNLFVLSSGAMAGVPLEVVGPLLGERVGERFRVSYVPSASSLVDLNQEVPAHPRTSERPILALADPPFNEEHLRQMRQDVRPEPSQTARGPVERHETEDPSRLPRLAATHDEIAFLRNRAPDGSRFLTREDASEEQLNVVGRDVGFASFGTIHLATHAIVNPIRPEQSYLALSQVGLDELRSEAISQGTYAPDGRLTVTEILRDWELQADLVVLSACETALGRPTQGDGFLGLGQAFLTKGARRVLVSLWPVEDSATSQFMQYFYESLEEGGAQGSYVDALFAARGKMREHQDEVGRRPYRHPYYWASFVLLGASN